jgi:hypothetical protein
VVAEPIQGWGCDLALPLGAVFVGSDCQPEYGLTLNVSHSNWGTITVEPNLPLYCPNAVVTLTAVPVSGKSFKEWTIYDPNYPGDVGHVTRDSNTLLHLTMDADRQVDADFKCGSGMEQVLPLLAAVMTVCAAAGWRRGWRARAEKGRNRDWGLATRHPERRSEA